MAKKVQHYGWLPWEDQHLRKQYGAQPPVAIARVLTEYLATTVGDPSARRTADEIIARAKELKLAGVADAPPTVGVNIRLLNALGRASGCALEAARDARAQTLFRLLSGVSDRDLSLAGQLIETEIYRRRKQKNGSGCNGRR